jgi:hypothetical protein
LKSDLLDGYNTLCNAIIDKDIFMTLISKNGNHIYIWKIQFSKTNMINIIEHICIDCNQIFNKKSVYVYHINKKYPCVKKTVNSKMEKCNKILEQQILEYDIIANQDKIKINELEQQILEFDIFRNQYKKKIDDLEKYIKLLE